MPNFTNVISRRYLSVASILFAAAANTLAEEPRVEAPSYNRLTDSQEIRLGREAAEGMEKEKSLRFIRTRSVRNYVEDLFDRITKTSRRPDLPYSIKIVDTKEINACALPGGFVYVNRGLLEWARSEAELAATLAHEVGHVVGRHGANSVSRVSSVDSLLTEASQVLFGDDLPARLLKQAGGPLAFLAMMKYNREQEAEADLFGYHNMQRASWDPNGMVELFRHFGERSSVLDPLFTLTSSHPASSERERLIRVEMRESPPRQNLVHDSEDFRQMQSDLKKLPPPVEQKRLGE